MPGKLSVMGEKVRTLETNTDTKPKDLDPCREALQLAVKGHRAG